MGNVLEEKKKKMNGNLYRFLYDTFTVNWYHRHWKPYEKMELLEVWDEILNECTKPLDFVKNEMEVIELLIKYEVISEEECKMKLLLSDEIVDELKGSIQIKKDEDELMRQMG